MMWDLRGASRSPAPPPLTVPSRSPVRFPTPLPQSAPPYEYARPYAPLLTPTGANGYGTNAVPFPSSSPAYSHQPSRVPTPLEPRPRAYSHSEQYQPHHHHHHRSTSQTQLQAQHIPRSRSHSFGQAQSQGHHYRSQSSQEHHYRPPSSQDHYGRSRSRSRHRHDSRGHSHSHHRSHSRPGHQAILIAQPFTSHHISPSPNPHHHHSHSHSHSNSHSHSRSRSHSHSYAQPAVQIQYAQPHQYQQYQQQQPQPQVQFALHPEQYPEIPRMLGLGNGGHLGQGHAHLHRAAHAMQHPLFAYSRCTGRRRGVCIGINYTGSRNELKGCVNDATNVWHFIVDNYHYPRDQVLFITDSTNEPRARPTRKNILRAMKWLVEGAQSDDALFFHYSGHGGQTKDRDGDEVDGYDEVIFPEDYQTAGVITDDDMHDIMVKPLPPGCRLTAVFDSCHSGSVLDLPYLYGYNGRVKGSQVSARFKSIKTTPADVITWSGCKDSQTSADTYKDGVAVGAMSYAFTKVLKRNPNISYQDLLRGVRDILKKKYSQTPQMSSSHHIDTNLKFIM